MKPPPFSYHDPKTVAEVIGLLSTLENAKLLAGGQSLMPMLNFRYVQPDHIVDLNRVEGLSYIRETAAGMEVGAMTRQRDIEFSDLIRARHPLMHEAIRQVGHRQTRNRGTLGGSLCHLDPSAELVSVAAALDATVTVAGPNGRREIAFADFPVAFMTPAIEPNELLTAVRFPVWPQGHGYAFIEFARRHGDFAIVSAAALLVEDGAGKIQRASMIIGGMGTVPIRAVELEQALIRQAPDDKLLREACETCRKLEAIDDVHAPASYRQHLAAVLSRRALEQARSRLPSRVAALAALQ
jgi:aerobic carbon-monoxide dehydrogenase medium subunit